MRRSFEYEAEPFELDPEFDSEYDSEFDSEFDSEWEAFEPEVEEEWYGETSQGNAPRIAAPSIQALKSDIVRLANQEWLAWDRGKKKESDPSMRAKLRDYWTTGARVTNIFSEANWWSAHPWSAAFISWIIRKAGAGNAFRYSAMHSVYTKAAKDNRLANNSNPFKAYRLREVRPQVGDLVCKSRDGSGANYDNIREGLSTHCDIVTEVHPDSLTTIGGNVSESVSKTSVRLDANGFITQPGYFAVIKLGATSRPSAPGSYPRPSLGPGSDSAIEALNLAEPARSAAYQLKAKHPWIVFTSGRRDLAGQARAMAGNVVRNRRWIEQTYTASPIIAAAQQWVNTHPQARTQQAIADGLLSVFQSFPSSEIGRMSRHLVGLAFDIRPVPSRLAEIKPTILSLPRMSKFLTKEGGLTIWHIQF